MVGLKQQITSLRFRLLGLKLGELLGDLGTKLCEGNLRNPVCYLGPISSAGCELPHNISHLGHTDSGGEKALRIKIQDDVVVVKTRRGRPR